jgi:hypothetical protein
MKKTTVNTYDVGDRVRVVGTFKDIAGMTADPTAVTIKIRKPSGTVVQLTGAEIDQEDVGVFYADVNLDQSGTWWYRFEGTGQVQAAEEHALNVRASRF